MRWCTCNFPIKSLGIGKSRKGRGEGRKKRRGSSILLVLGGWVLILKRWDCGNILKGAWLFAWTWCRWSGWHRLGTTHLFDSERFSLFPVCSFVCWLLSAFAPLVLPGAVVGFSLVSVALMILHTPPLSLPLSLSCILLIAFPFQPVFSLWFWRSEPLLFLWSLMGFFLQIFKFFFVVYIIAGFDSCEYSNLCILTKS